MKDSFLGMVDNYHAISGHDVNAKNGFFIMFSVQYFQNGLYLKDMDTSSLLLAFGVFSRDEWSPY